MKMEFRSVVDVSKLDKKGLIDAMDKEVYRYARDTINAIVDEFYSGRNAGKGLDAHTKQAKYGWKYKVRQIKVGDDSRGTIVFYNTSPHANFNEKKVVRAGPGKMMSIPLDAATSSPEWGKKFQGGPRQAGKLFDTFMFKNKNGTLFIVRKDKFKQDPTNKAAYLYVLKDEVKIPAYTEGLPDFAQQRLELLGPALAASIARRFK